MKAIIVSDTHGHNANYGKILKMHNPDLVIHCGDIEGSENVFTQVTSCPIYMVKGNNDYFSDLPREVDVSFGGNKIWVTHGHNFYVSVGTEIIKEEARSRGAKIVCFGHTHRPIVEYGADVIAVNPGSLSYPRQEGRLPSYAIMEIDRFGELHVNIAYIK